MTIPPCWTFYAGDSGDSEVGLAPEPPNVWAPAPNGDAVELCRIMPCRYRIDGDGCVRELCSEIEIGNLIAAAPDLLAACKLAKAFDWKSGSSAQLIYETLDAAIAKATGADR